MGICHYLCSSFPEQHKNNPNFIVLSQHQKYSQIKKQLIKIRNQQYRSQQIIQILQIFNSYYQKRQNYNKNHILLDNFKHQIKPIFGYLADVILKMQKQSIRIPILYSGKGQRAKMNRRQIIYLLALMSFNLVPLQSYQITQKSKNFNKNNNFYNIFKNSLYKSTCLIQYFKLCQQTNALNQNKQNFTIERIIENNSLYNLFNSKKMTNLKGYSILSDKSSIQQYYGEIKVDFANKFIGGGALSNGCVQEQIMFCNHPEMFVSSLLCQKMNDNQSIFFTGFRKYFKNNGYSYSTQFAGKQNISHYEKDEQNQYKQYTTAIDAVQYKKNQIFQQYNKNKIDRQILKAFTGFKNLDQQVPIVTGNWGCGAFNGNLTLKFMIQWIAASLAGKHMRYCPYGKSHQIENYKNVLQMLQKYDILAVYKILIQSAKCVKHENQNIFPIVQNLMNQL